MHIFSLLSLTPFLMGCETTPNAAPPVTPATTATMASNGPKLLLFSDLQTHSSIPEGVTTLIYQGKFEEAILQLNSNEEPALINKIWLLLHSDDPSRAIPFKGAIEDCLLLPSDFRVYMLIRILILEGDLTSAQTLLETLDETSPMQARAKWFLIEALLNNIQKDDNATNLTTQLAQWLDVVHPVEQGDAAFASLIEHSTDATQKYDAMRELWSSYPYSPSTKSLSARLQHFEAKGHQFKPTMEDWHKRSTQTMAAYQWKSTITELKPIVSNLKMTDSASCAVLYAYGRSHFKINSVTKASQILPKVGRECQGKNDDVGAKAWYLTGKSLERKKMWKEAAEAYQQIPKLYPDHSMADDGYALAGIGYQESGDPTSALNMWTKQVTEFPEGDLVGEGFWRLAWTSFLEGDTAKAIEWADQAKATVPAEGHPYQYFAFHYWSARWKVYPSNTAHTVQNTDTSTVETGINEWKALITEHPTEFYTVLASARLWELEPDWMTTQQFKAPTVQSGWFIDSTLAESPALLRAQQLSHVGLTNQALLQLAPLRKQSPTTAAIYSYALSQVDMVTGHDLLHKYIQHHPPHTWTANHHPIWYHTFPNHYWDLLSAHQSNHPDDYPYDVRIFHSLVREESSFNKDIVSWAGAKGLSQLMPATASRVGEWVGITVNNSVIFDPSSNLRIGSKYLGYLHGYFNNNSFLAVAAYNAGEGNVGKWLNNKGNLPTDMFVESIPFRETRHYVKRVLGTYQTYHMLYDQKEGTPAYPNFSAFNHTAKP